MSYRNCVKIFLYELTKALFLFINDVNDLTIKRKGLINIKLFVEMFER